MQTQMRPGRNISFFAIFAVLNNRKERKDNQIYSQTKLSHSLGGVYSAVSAF